MRGLHTLLANGGVLRPLGEPAATGATAEDAPPASGVARFELQ